MEKIAKIAKICKDYGVTPKVATYLVDNYNTVDMFYGWCAWDYNDLDSDKYLQEGRIFKKLFRSRIGFDIDYSLLDIEYIAKLNELIYDLRCYSKEHYIQDFIIYSSKGMQKAISTLTPREADIVNLRYGLYNDEALSLKEIAKKYNVGAKRIWQILAKALRKLRHPSRCRLYKTDLDESLLDDADKFIYYDIVKDMMITRNKDKYTESILAMNSVIERMKERKNLKKEAIREWNINWKNKTFRDLEFSDEVCTQLERCNIHTLGELNTATLIETQTTEFIDELRSQLAEYGLIYAESSAYDINIDTLNLSVRTYNILRRAGLYTLGNIASVTESYLMSLCGMGKKSLYEIQQILKEHNLILSA